MKNPGLAALTMAGALRGLTVFVIGLLLAFAVAFLVRQFMRWRGRGSSSRRILSRVLFWVLALLSLMAALTVVFPSINPVDVLGGLGVISVAAGIAFQTVLGNMFAGMVILSRDRFRVGDQVIVGENAGTITQIHLSSTIIRTFDGQLVIIPNTIMHSTQVVVQTGFERIRTCVRVALSTSADFDQAQAVAEKTMRNLDLVMNEPAPRAMFSEVGTESVTMELLFWSGSTKLESREATDTIIRTVVSALQAEGVPLATSGLENAKLIASRAFPNESAGKPNAKTEVSK
ncbi:small-conductance mechanosensitive ion channel [Boudabousia tangfeifanii]|uniref:Small-conductance mechanosensitive ion channel n=1 Tax=Boudabousia tangfeifanii TaxID=1912795 RepID=A0A1D9ML89_9ACTO|nr:mechanosensitive ion channel domain-containing protein [Boudabousia tangfeifanii]AOZ73062.1 small-conductance mechanosensitive ion channel [Boudabousia tangfeifanii]